MNDRLYISSAFDCSIVLRLSLVLDECVVSICYR